MRPGTKVVCVDDSKRPEIAEWQPKNCPNWVKKGEEYTIRAFTTHGNIVPAVLLEEVVNKPVYCVPFGCVMEPHFAAWRFRELQTPDPIADTMKNEVYA